jgi:sn-glycerol 3-phosphate transport system substrate-binding protein
MSEVSRRTLFQLAGGAAAAAFLASCGDDSAGGSTTTAKAATGGSTTTAAASNPFNGVKPAAEITYWSVHPAKSKAAEEELITRFQAANPGIKVKLETAGANYAEVSQKFQAGLAAKSVPDVVMLSDVWWFKYFLAKTITPMDDLIRATGIKLDDYQDSLIKDYQFQGKQWAMPFARSTPLFYYNKEKWAAAGLPDRAPESWDEFETWAPKLQEKMGSGQFAFTHVKGDSYIAWTFQSIIWAFGGRYSDESFKLLLDSKEATDAGNYVRAQVNERKWAKDEAADFTSGQTAAIISSTGGLAGILRDAKFPVGTGFLPKKTAFGCPTGGAGLAIPASISPERQLAAMTFIAFLGQPEQTAYYSQNIGYMPVRKSAVEGPLMADFFKEKPQFRTAVDQLAKTRSQDTARVYVPGGDSIIGKGLERMTLSNEPADKVWKDVSGELQKVIDTEVKPKLG